MENKHEIGDIVTIKRGDIELKGVVKDKRRSYGKEELKVEPLKDQQIKIEKWIRKLEV